MSRPVRGVTLVAPFVLCLGVGAVVAPAAVAQQVPPPAPEQQAAQLDRDGATALARVMWQALIDSASDPTAKARAERSMAMSYAFDGDCAGTGKYEAMAMAYWQSREQTDPHTAFYQEGEIADEAARVCLDAGDVTAAETWYRKGYDRGTSEPAPVAHSRALWNYRLAHALGRIAARRGDAVEARREIAVARRILDGDSALAAAQERFFSYLVGYVALYTHDLATADSQLTKAIAWRDNERDPFLHCLLGMTYELEGRQSDANSMYRTAYDLATGHNPPAAFVRRFVRKKVALAGGGG